MRILLTGARGFVGRHLADELGRRNHEVISTTRRIDFKEFYLDITDYRQCVEVFRRYVPDAIVNLAGQSMVSASWDNPRATAEANCLGVVNIIQAVAELNLSSRIITVGSGEEYGLTAKSGRCLTEEDYCMPQNPYAISKFTAGIFGMQLTKKYGIKHVHVRAFNHFGPGQGKGFVVSDFASQVAYIESRSPNTTLRVGNLDAYRDILDVRDVVSAYADLVEHEDLVGVYNVCSGKGTKIKDVLNVLLGFSRIEIEVEVNTDLFRPLEVPIFVGSPRKLTTAVGWKPTIPFEQSLKETLTWWRSQV